jgi:hypothetical protein
MLIALAVLEFQLGLSVSEPGQGNGLSDDGANGGLVVLRQITQQSGWDALHDDEIAGL